MSAGFVIHWIAAILLIGMATFAYIEAKSSSLIPKSLFLWPLCGFLFGVLAVLGPVLGRGQMSGKSTLLALGIVFLLCSVQALLVNIRKLSRWPSGAIWLGFLLLGLLYQIPFEGAAEPLFHTFLRRISGFVWMAVGITKVISEKTVSQEGQTPPWILLLYVQAALIASFPS